MLLLFVIQVSKKVKIRHQKKTQEDNSRARHNVRDPRRFRPEAGSHKAASVESLKLSDDMIRH
jgi:hypothetical protein